MILVVAVLAGVAVAAAVVAWLWQTGQRTLAEHPEASPSAVTRRGYASAEREQEVLRSVDDLHLIHLEEGLRLVTYAGDIISPRSPRLQRLGIYSFGPRGTTHYRDANRLGDFRAGQPVALVREPDNPYDSNAVAVCAPDRLRFPVGYVNKQRAKTLAKILDSGADIVAISLEGGGAGDSQGPRFVLACERRLLDRLRDG